ncbi:MAG: hypothetical protein PF569_02490 [Candidatus Woesearchaeota archaeon]|jgi:hypothetical protein|nr:hypothetical protein [Candidatus Woesearchaeota archaeon]
MENEINALYRLNIDCGRSGELYGIFIADKDAINHIIHDKIKIYFGEVLGKHSEIFGVIDEGEIELITDDPKILSIVEKYNLEIGINPLDFIEL